MSMESFAWADALESLYEQVWVRLQRGVNDRHAPGRHPALATVDAQGAPQIRTVVLRAADQDSATLQVYTDLYATKVNEIQAHPLTAIHIWDSVAHLQIRLQANAAIRTGTEVEANWERVTAHGRKCYGMSPAPGQPINAGLAYHKAVDRDAFAVIDLSVQAMDILHLGRQHRRARFERKSQWAGQWLAP